MKIKITQNLQSDPPGADVRIGYSYEASAPPSPGALIRSGYRPANGTSYPSRIVREIYSLESDQTVEIELESITVPDGEKFTLEIGWRLIENNVQRDADVKWEQRGPEVIPVRAVEQQ